MKFRELTMKIQVAGQNVILKGDPSICCSVASLKTIYKYNILQNEGDDLLTKIQDKEHIVHPKLEEVSHLLFKRFSENPEGCHQREDMIVPLYRKREPGLLMSDPKVPIL